MKLIADSGSTKTEWILINNTKIEIFNTIGLNPVIIDESDVYETLTKSELSNKKEDITDIYFFGAGCSSDDKKNVIKNALSDIFKNATILVESDLLGAGISMFGKSEGIIGILGTGSNTGIYNNGKILNNINSLGNILGDEGSGSYIGKIFLKKYLENELPEIIASKFDTEFNLNLNKVINKVYKEPFPNRFLASFMPFIYKNKADKFIQELLTNCFNDFFNKTILKYKDYQNYEIKLIGSIAHFFSDEIKKSANQLNIKISKIEKSPSIGLIEFYK